MGNAVVVTKLDRFARSTQDALNTMATWTERGVSLVVLNMGYSRHTCKNGPQDGNNCRLKSIDRRSPLWPFDQVFCRQKIAACSVTIADHNGGRS